MKGLSCRLHNLLLFYFVRKRINKNIYSFNSHEKNNLYCINSFAGFSDLFFTKNTYSRRQSTVCLVARCQVWKLVLVVSLQAIGEKIVTQKTINSMSNMSPSYSLVHSLQRCVRIILTFPEKFKLGIEYQLSYNRKAPI